MPEPRGQVIRRLARDLAHPDPDNSTFRSLDNHIQQLEATGWIDGDQVRAELSFQLDGARPYY